MNSSFGRGSLAPAPLAASGFVCYNADRAQFNNNEPDSKISGHQGETA